MSVASYSLMRAATQPTTRRVDQKQYDLPAVIHIIFLVLEKFGCGSRI